jgi:hypothetical protein
LTIPRKHSLDAPFYLLDRQHTHALLGLREVRRVHLRVVLVEEGVYLLVAFLDIPDLPKSVPLVLSVSKSLLSLMYSQMSFETFSLNAKRWAASASAADFCCSSV